MRPGTSALLLAATVCTAWAACVHKAPTPPATGEAVRPQVRIPAGCEADLSGEYVHALNDSFRYRGIDDGGTLTLRLERAAPDGGVSAPDGGEALQQIVLERTPEGFRGATEATAFPRGNPCQVRFPTEVTACSDAGITLLAADEVAVSSLSCAPSSTGARPAMIEQRLNRTGAVPPSAPDGGTRSVTPADAGS